MIEKQFRQNLGIITENELLQIGKLKILLVGCGGIGGNVANLLIRLGVHHLTIVDDDSFDESNLNRQLFSNYNSLKKYKVDILKEQLLLINPNATIIKHIERIESMDKTIFNSHDYIIDAVDNPQTKVFLNEASTEFKVPLLHGACGGWYAQVGWIEPGCYLIKDLYSDKKSGLEEMLKNPSFTPSITASYMVSEFVKYALNRNNKTVNQLILIDLLSNSIISTNGGHSHD